MNKVRLLVNRLGWKKKLLTCFLACLILSSAFITSTFAQRLNVNIPSFESYYRRNQLLGKLDSTVSFAIRPLDLGKINLRAISMPDSLNQMTRTLFRSTDEKTSVGVLPAFWQQQYLSSSLQSRNDGSLIPAKGYQTQFSAGVFATLGPLRIQIRPEFVFAENRDYETRRLFNGPADLPQRFGTKSYTQLSWGQSSIGFDFDPVSISLSNENLWWGPGLVNSLLMSNSAPGFKHLSLNTNQPIRTPVGSVEAQVVAGRLEGSGYDSSLPNDWRYFSGLVFSYQPRWIPGLFLGLTRSFQIYSKDMDNSFGDILPFFQAFQKIQTNEDAKRRDQLTSIFSRLLLPSAKAEVYFEYGLNDHSYNIRDFLMAPEHSRAYLLGMKKLLPYKQRDGEFLEFTAEITHLEQSIDRTVREAGEWYTHYQVLHGYTNRGQLLGAGIGPGGNFQSLGISWVKGLNQLGFQLERYEHNGDLASVGGYSPWIDFSLATVADWQFNKFLLNAKLQGIQAINYQWKDGINGRPKRNFFTVNAQVGIMYSF